MTPEGDDVTFKRLLQQGLTLWFLASLALAGVHRMRGGDWSRLPEDLAWAALVAAIVVASRRWHASRGSPCALCVDSAPNDRPGTSATRRE